MTSLTFAYHSVAGRFVGKGRRLRGFSRVVAFPFVDTMRRAATPFLIFIVLLTVVAYLAALYFSFSLGFQIQERNTFVADLSRDLLDANLTLQQKEVQLAGEHDSILQSMEKVSVITYITPHESVAILTGPEFTQ
jgi:hypothetical protein